MAKNEVLFSNNNAEPTLGRMRTCETGKPPSARRFGGDVVGDGVGGVALAGP